MRLPPAVGIVLHSSIPVKNAVLCVYPHISMRRKVLGVYSQEACVHILKIHRILIASGIIVCLVYAGREVATYSNAHSSASLIHAALAVAAAVALGIYLYSIRKL
jgi:hypothetical protein